MLSRRHFLENSAAGLSAVALGGTMPALFAQAAEAARKAQREERTLVVVELSGGNDGLNTLVPLENDLYYRNRPTLAIPKGQAFKLADQVGLHPQMKDLADLFHDGRLAIVQGVGYPDPDRSHFRSMEIWHTASVASPAPTTGWLGRYLDGRTQPKDQDDASLAGLALAGSLPQALEAEKFTAPVVGSLETIGDATPSGKVLKELSTKPSDAAGPVAFLRTQATSAYRAAERLREATNGYQSSVTYPGSELGNQLRRAAQIISSGLPTRILYAAQGGYDTHAAQLDQHAGLLADLSASLAAFQRDLEGLKAADRVVTLVFSEFGRRVDENASQGTDHGAASCLFVLGAKAKGGLYGAYPSLEKLGDGDLIFNTDFRSVYATLLDRWLGATSQSLLGSKFPTIDLIAG
jgi:uncharacterized protein (DUF1501 family)